MLGKEHLDTLESMNELSTVLNSLGKYKEAEQMQQQVFQEMERILGKEHPGHT